MLTELRGKRRKSQGMTEYIIIVAMIAIAAIVVVKVFGKQIRNVFYSSSQSLGEGKPKEPDKETYAEERELKGYYKREKAGSK